MKVFVGPVCIVSTILSCGLASAGERGAHLGMKLACKHYGDAWNSGSKGALYGVATSDFAAQFGRVPDDMFAQMPRGGGGGVAGSFKSRGGGYGEVSVSTSQGPMTFILVGSGFHWRVADIQKSGDGGQWVSLKSYLDASLTAREFMVSFHGGDDGFRYSASSGFNGGFNALPADDLVRVRRVLPPPCLNVKPYLIFNGSYADLTVTPPDGQPGDRVTIRLVNEGSWKVNDFGIDTAKMRIASFQRSMPALACVAALGQFIEDPEHHDPAGFTPAGELRTALAYAKSKKPFLMKSNDVRTKLEVSDDGKTVFAHYPGRLVRMSLTDESRLAKIELSSAQDKWSDVAQAIAVQRKFQELSVASLASFPFGRPKTAAVKSVLVNAGAVERVVDKTVAVASKAISKGLPQPKKLDIGKPADAKVEVASAVSARKVEKDARGDVTTTAVKAEVLVASAAPISKPIPTAQPKAVVDSQAVAQPAITPEVQPASYYDVPQQSAPQYVPYQNQRRVRGRRWR